MSRLGQKLLGAIQVTVHERVVGKGRVGIRQIIFIDCKIATSTPGLNHFIKCSLIILAGRHHFTFFIVILLKHMTISSGDCKLF